MSKEAQNTNITSELFSIWHLVNLILSTFVLILLFIEIVVPLDPATKELFRVVDTSVCLVFLGDFFYQIITRKDKLGYLKWGWIDLVSSIPTVGILRVGRLARIARIIRVFRAARVSKVLIHELYKHRTRNIFVSVLGGSLLLVLVATLSIKIFEKNMAATDALWWSLYALLTGELGEYIPRTLEGRVIATLLMTAGVALFGTFTASLATFFLEPEQEEDEQRDVEILAEIKKLSTKIDSLETEIKTTRNRNRSGNGGKK
jgi:voltage-gated potassium channel